MLCVQYYDYCMTTLVDCMGRPLVSMSETKLTHFVLVIIVLGKIMFDFVFSILCEKKWGKKFFNIRKVKFTNLRERFFFICMLFGVSINFGLRDYIR